MRVAEVVQADEEILVRDRLPEPQLHGAREHARQHAVAFAVQPRVDDARELHVVVPEHAEADQGEDAEHRERTAQPDPAPGRTRVGLRGWGGGGHDRFLVAGF